MRWPWQKYSQQNCARIGIAMFPSGAMAAVACRNHEVMGMLTADHHDWSQLGSWARQLGCREATVRLVLPTDDYQLQMLPAPDVSDEELSQAMRFRLGELTTVPLEQLLVQSFRLPGDAYRGRQSMAFVAFAERHKVAALVDCVREQDMRLEQITIGELALLDVLADVEPEASIAILQLDAKGGRTMLYRDGALYLRRDFNIGYQALATELQASHQADSVADHPVTVKTTATVDAVDDAVEEEASEFRFASASLDGSDGLTVSDDFSLQPQFSTDPTQATEAVEAANHSIQTPASTLLATPELDRLTLEIQRSLDYFDSQLAMGVVGQLWLLVSSNPLEEKLLLSLEHQLSLPCRRLSLRSWLGDTDQQWNLATTFALGAALGESLSEDEASL